MCLTCDGWEEDGDKCQKEVGARHDCVLYIVKKRLRVDSIPQAKQLDRDILCTLVVLISDLVTPDLRVERTTQALALMG